MKTLLLAKAYEPAEVEVRWYRYWEEQQLFRADENNKTPAYSIVIPPPNVTGDLHMGHALNNTLQDILCRYKRMQGYNVLWMPGTDHAGIATQNVVERQLAEEGLDRHELGREKFIERVWEWRELYGDKIINQLKRLGASCDWSRERFTMDEGLSEAVRRVFVSLYHEGLIYRGQRIINWCPRCITALANLEVEAEERAGRLYHIRYPSSDGSNGLVVVTTRPETMLGDTGVAVHPDDDRYREYIGKTVILPLLNRELPVVADEYVEMAFGSGTLKVTPAHDPYDFEIGQRHGLPSLKVMDDQGVMNEEAGPYVGLDRDACREKIVADLKEQGFLLKIEDYQHRVGHCYRCKTIIEPTLSKQWFVSVKQMAEVSMAAVREGKTRIVPEMWERNYFDWLENIEDWCISRQIWWGHRIPAWYCQDCDEVIVAMEEPKQCSRCSSGNLVQESDVLDTWFSSALWPFSTMGWPEKTSELEIFYPTSVLVTGFDILFFWVARMMMMGLHFMKDVPFRDVYIHALVRDAEGMKMSKSKGNVIDPLVIMDLYGTDAFRFTLAAFAAQGRDIRLSEERVEGYRHFINKIWNASRFTLMNLEGVAAAGVLPKPKRLADRWMLSRLQEIFRQVNEALESYHFNEAASVIYQFTWHEFCDWYLEFIKPVLYGDNQEEREETQQFLLHGLSCLLRLLHPFVPYVTEELWHHLPSTKGTIMTAEYPAPAPSLVDREAEEQMALVMDVTTAIRNIRGEMNVAPAARVDAVVFGPDNLTSVVRAHGHYIEDLARLSTLEMHRDGQRPRASASAVVRELELFVPLEGILDFEEESKRLRKEIRKLEPELGRVKNKLANTEFLTRAPTDIVAKEKDKCERLGGKLDKLRTQLERLTKLRGEG
ncbi:MAG: valine--tRNA ligase [Deltaproteobacteria bacterium]|nr:MAG: valine--tRNA ligase [Deltaproteobacteria bacterium]